MAIKETPSKERHPLRNTLALGGAILTVAGLVELQQYRNQYGYDPARNRPAPSYLDTQKGINPADNVAGDGSK